LRRGTTGRTQVFNYLRKLALEIASEPAKRKDGTPVILDGKVLTTAEVILRQWAMSSNPMAQEKFLQIAYGKVPDKVAVTDDEGNEARPVIHVHFPEPRGEADG